MESLASFVNPEGDTVSQRPDPSSLELFLRPPGGILVWGFIIVELLTFGAGFFAFLYERSAAVEVFKQSQQALNTNLAAVNTAVLLISGFLVAEAVRFYEKGETRPTVLRLSGAAALGILFLALKSFEYLEKLKLGLGMGENPFFSYYWGLTGFHFIHVLVGVLVLMGMAWHIHRGGTFAEEDASLETGAAFWHMCDLIWVVLFPLLYILR